MNTSIRWGAFGSILLTVLLLANFTWVQAFHEEEYARNPRKRKLDWRQIGLAALLIGPNLLLLILFTYRPLVDNIRISFFNWNISSPTMTFVGLQNYIDWF